MQGLAPKYNGSKLPIRYYQMALLFICDGEDPKPWMERLLAEIPELDIRVWPNEVGIEDDIDVALAWLPPKGVFKQFRNLRAILSLGAGVEHILKDTTLDRTIEVARLLDSGLKTGMVEFVTLETLRYHRREPEYRAQQQQEKWLLLSQPLTENRHIGILGLGYLGGACAEHLKLFGFSVSGWARTEKEIEGISCYTGEDGFFKLLEQSEILVCLLPLTRETENILDATAFGALPPGASLINVGRGGHLVEDDLLKYLDNGHLFGATLDVFREEPLPSRHPFWSHPKIIVYPHAAAWSLPITASPVIADNLRRIAKGENLIGLVDRKRGY